EFWATAKLHHNSIRFKIDTKKSVLDLEAFREMLHISPRISNQSFAELPTKEEILDFPRFLGHSHEIRYLTDVNGLYHSRNVDFAYLIWEDFVYQMEHKNTKRSNKMYYPRFTKVIIDYFMTRKPSISRRNRINWHYVRDDILFSTIKVVSRHQTTQQYGAILPIELTNDKIRNSKAYKEYYACATGEVAPKLKASARKKKGDSASSTTPPTPTPTTIVVSAPRLSATAKGKQPARATAPTEPTDMERIEAEQLKIILKRSRQETQISQQRGSGIDEGTDVGGQDEGDKNDESDDGSDEGSDDDNDKTVKASSDKDNDDNDDDNDNDEEEELAKDDDEETETGKGGDEVSESEGESDDEETRQEEEGSFDPIPRTPEGSEEESNDEEDQELRLSEEARIQEEEEADELYRDVNINQRRGLQVTQNVEDSHVTLTSVNPDGPQESSSVSSFVTSMLNPTNDVGVESIFTTASSSIVSLQTPTPIMTPSTIATITTSGDAPIPPPTIPSIILENLPTFNSVFRIDERLGSLETSFSEYRQTNPFVDAVFAILGIVHQYMTQQMMEAVREAVQIQTDWLQDSLQRENNEFLRNIDENMKRIIKGQVKNQVKEQVSRILPRTEESVNATLEAEVLTRSSHSSRTSYVIAADLSEMELKKILIENMEGNKSIQQSDEQRNLYKALVEAYDADKAILDTYGESTILKRRREDDDQEGPSARSNRGSKRQKEGGEHAPASTPSETATGGIGRSTKGSQSRQLSASESAFAEEPVQTTSFRFEERFRSLETSFSEYRQTNPFADAVFAIPGIVHQYVTQQIKEAVREAPRRPPSPDHAWNKTLPAAQGDAQSWISDLARQTDARSPFNELLDTPIDFSNFIMNRLNVDTLTPELLPLPLIPDNQGRRTIPFDHFINNDLEYLWRGLVSLKMRSLGKEHVSKQGRKKAKIGINIKEEGVSIAVETLNATTLIISTAEITLFLLGVKRMKEAFGWLLDKIHMTWDHLEKKRARLRLYTKSVEEILIQTVKTVSPSLTTMSEHIRDDVRSFKTVSECSRLKRNPRSFVEVTTLGNLRRCGEKDDNPQALPYYTTTELKIISVLFEITLNLATRAIKTPLSSSMGTMWCLCDLTPSTWKPSSPKRVHFINSIIIQKKENKPEEEEIIESSATKENDHNRMVKKEDEAMKTKESAEEIKNEETEEETEEEEEDEPDFFDTPLPSTIEELSYHNGF
nr:hypothetical protein [Tanacetum cinerariifolium]